MAKAISDSKRLKKPFEIVGEFTPTKGVQKFFGGKSRMWVARRRRLDPQFPKPIFFGGSDRPHWRISDLEKYANQCATEPQSKAGVPASIEP